MQKSVGVPLYICVPTSPIVVPYTQTPGRTSEDRFTRLERRCYKSVSAQQGACDPSPGLFPANFARSVRKQIPMGGRLSGLGTFGKTGREHLGRDGRCAMRFHVQGSTG